MIQDTQTLKRANNQSCPGENGRKPYRYDPDMEYTTLPNGVTRIAPKVPPYQISDKELTAALFEIPYGMVVRENDLLEKFQKEHKVRFVSIDYSAYWRNWNRWDIPYWRVVSSNGRANGLLVPRDEQILKLKEEGLTVERVYNSYKVVDWKKGAVALSPNKKNGEVRENNSVFCCIM